MWGKRGYCGGRYIGGGYLIYGWKIGPAGTHRRNQSLGSMVYA
jgi:hypothetical protein